MWFKNVKSWEYFNIGCTKKRSFSDTITLRADIRVLIDRRGKWMSYEVANGRPKGSIQQD